MRLESLSLKGLLRFTDPVTIDFRSLPPGLIAVVGANGAGKTTLLEAFFALLYREWPSRDGELVQYATGRDSFLDATFAIDGVGAYRARVNLDAHTRGSDGILEQVGASGARFVLSDGRVSDYDRAVRERFPSASLMLASAFRAQNGRGNFISLSKKDRKDRFAELLGMQRYAVMSQTAAAAVARLSAAIAPLETRVDVLTRNADESASRALDDLAHDLQRQGGEAEIEKRRLVQHVQDLETRLAVYSDAQAAYAVADAQLRRVDDLMAAARAELAAAQRRAKDLDATYLTDVSAATATRDADVAEAEKRIAANQAIQEAKGRIEVAVACTAALDDALAAARESQDEATRDLAVATKALRDAERAVTALVPTERDLTRATIDAGIVNRVPCGGTGAYAACQFLTNATAATARIAELQAALHGKAALLDAVAGAARQVEDAERRVEEARTLIADAEKQKAKHRDYASRATLLAESTAKIEGYTAAIQKADADLQATLTRLAERLRAAHAVIVGQMDFHARALSALAVERQQAADARAATETGHAQATVLRGDLDRARAEWDGVVTTLARVASARAELERRRLALAATRDEVAQLRERIALLQTERAEWQLLTAALGRDGLPVLEIDAAGPTISAYTNELLAVCFGTRFTVDLVTQQAKANGKGMKEAFTVEVYDNLRGGDVRDVADLSGGEQTIVAEALMNAIALYANQTAPMPIRTCWRDETTGALDPENAVRYLQMLRKVHELGGYHHIVFITHNPDVAAMADAQLVVQDGRVTTSLPPFTEGA